MRRFQFRLQTVLDLRTRERERVQLTVAAAEQARQQTLEAIQGQQAAIRQAIADHGELPVTQQTQPAIAHGVADFLSACRLQERRLRDVLAQQDEVLVGLRGHLKQAYIRQRALEVLRDKAQAAHRQQRVRHEALVLEDLLMSRHGRTEASQWT